MSEQIMCVAIRYPDEMGVFSLPRPARHHHVMWTRLLISGQRTTGEAEQGFLTTTGRFVDREEGLEIAKREDQIIKKHGSDTLLFSEDMWDTPAEARDYRIMHDREDTKLTKELAYAVWMVGNMDTAEDKAAWWADFDPLWNKSAEIIEECQQEGAVCGEGYQAFRNSVK